MSGTKQSKKPVKMGVGNLTENDLRLIAIAWNCLEDTKIDLAKFTKATDYANSTSARVCFNVTKRKLATYFASLTAEKAAEKGEGAATTPAKKHKAEKEEGDVTTPTKRKAGYSSEDDDDIPSSPAPKKQRKAAKKPATSRKGKKQAVRDIYSESDYADES